MGEAKTTSEDKTDIMGETRKEELLLIPEDKLATEETKDAIIDKLAAEIANLKEQNISIDDEKIPYYSALWHMRLYVSMCHYSNIGTWKSTVIYII